MEARAVAKFVRISPRKARLVVDLVRGEDVDRAVSILKHTPKRGCMIVEKVLNSAVARIHEERGVDFDSERVFIKEIFVDKGATMKRFMPRAMGRATQILKRTSHITVIVAERGVG